MTYEQAVTAVANWQEALKIRDWEITLQIVSQEEMPSHTIQGTCAPNVYKRKATIHLLRIEDCTEEDPELQQRTILVHELLHILLAPFDYFLEDEKDAGIVFLEQIIETLAPLITNLVEQVRSTKVLAHAQA